MKLIPQLLKLLLLVSLEVNISPIIIIRKKVQKTLPLLIKYTIDAGTKTKAVNI